MPKWARRDRRSGTSRSGLGEQSRGTAVAAHPDRRATEPARGRDLGRTLRDVRDPPGSTRRQRIASSKIGGSGL